jgi:ribonuclease VapC
LSFVIDSSVLVAISLPEAEADHFSVVVELAAAVYVGWPTMLETWTVLSGRLSPNQADITIAGLLKAPEFHPMTFEAEHYHFARQAYERFRLNGHAAKLNYGDTMSYALARVMDLPLLFKGKDFGLTDVKVHPASVLA